MTRDPHDFDLCDALIRSIARMRERGKSGERERDAESLPTIRPRARRNFEPVDPTPNPTPDPTTERQ